MNNLPTQVAACGAGLIVLGLFVAICWAYLKNESDKIEYFNREGLGGFEYDEATSEKEKSE